MRNVVFAVCSLLLTGTLLSAAEPDLQRMKYNNPGLEVDLGVGLWGWPLPFDYDDDGDLDLLVSCSDVPYRGMYFFENPGGDELMPVFKPGKLVGPGIKNIGLSYVDKTPRVLVPGFELTGVTEGDFTKKQKIYPKTNLADASGRVRANQWAMVDYDGDGKQDLVAGLGLWADYGWDDAFNEEGEWTRGPLHGYVYWMKNEGSNENPDYGNPTQVQAEGKPVDVYGMPSPNFADFDQDGDLDLLCGDFIDGFTWFENVGSRKEPKYAAGRELEAGGKLLEMPLCMIVVSAVDWDRDGDVDLVVGQEDGRVALMEHTGKVKDHMPQFKPPRFFQQEADDVKFGALVTPVSFDWDNDGDEDLVCGNTAGEVGFIENLDGANPPKWAAPKLIEADGKPIVIQAGYNGSIQGPAETKWGYTTIDVADWNHDGLPDIVLNSIWGQVVWFENEGTLEQPKLKAEQSIVIETKGPSPYPAWNWWKPFEGELVTQWRTTPCVADWDEDGLNDLVMLDHEGYLAWFQRQKQEDKLVLLPGKRVFHSGSGDSKEAKLLRLNDKNAGGSGRRKICIVDWNNDGQRDLLLNSVNVDLFLQTQHQENSWTFENQGAMFKHRLAGHTTSPTTTDWDGDGKREVLIGAEDGYFYYPSEN